MGITGQVGGAAARTLLDTGLSVRGVMRDAANETCGVRSR
jgi:GDP-D-mannose dehydratase